MKRFRIEVVCDEFYIADSLRELATMYEDEMVEGEYHLDHGTAIIEEYKEEEG